MATASSVIAGRALVLIEAVDKSGKVFPKVMARFNNLNKTIERLKSRGMSSIDAYRIALSRLVLPLVGMEKNWTAFGKLTGFVLDTIGRKIKQLGQQSLMLGFQLAAAAAVMFMPLKDSVQEAAKLDTELLKAKAAAELTDEELQNLSKTVKETSRGTTFLSTEIAQVAKNLARAGLKGEQLEAGLLPVLNLARSTDYDPERAAELFVQAITVFDKGVNEYQKVADNFVTAANESVVDMDDLGAAFSYVAGTAESTRFGLTKTLAALAQLSFSGLTGSKGGTSLNQFLETLGQKAEDIEETFGVKAFDISGQMRNPLDLLAEIGDVLRALPDEQKLPHLTRIFNVRGARAVKALRTLENLTSMIDKMNTQTGIAAEQAGILDRGFEGSIRRILRSVSLLKVELGEAFREPLAKFAKSIENLIDKMIPWFQANHKAVQIFGLLTVATFAAAAALMVFAGIAFVISTVITSIGTAFTLLAPLIGPVVTAITAFFTAFGGWAVAGIVLAIIGVFAIVLKTITKIGPQIKKLGISFFELIKTIYTFGEAIFSGPIKALQIIIDLLAEIIGLVLGFAMVGIIVPVLDTITDGLKAIGQVLDWLIIQQAKELKDTFNQIAKEFSDIAFGRDFLTPGQKAISDLLDRMESPDPEIAAEAKKEAEERFPESLIRERLDLLKRKAELGMGLANTATASSITMEAGSVADREATFRDRQQESVLNELRKIEDRLRVIESQQRSPALSLGGI